MNKTYIAIVALAASMAGCDKKPSILYDYDDFTNRKICKLETFKIKHESGFGGYRSTSLSLQKLDEKNVRASITCIVPNPKSSYPVIIDGTKLIFNVFSNNQKEQMIFIAEKHQADHISHADYTQYGTRYYSTYDSTVFFNLTIEQLSKIANAEKVEFAFETKEIPIRGVLEKSAFDNCVDFINACYKN